MFVIDEKNGITLTRGDSAPLTLTLTQGETPYDFSNDTVRFGVKRNAFDTSEPVILKTFDASGMIKIEPEDTATLQFGDYVYDVQVETQDGDVYTPIAAARFTVGFSVF